MGKHSVSANTRQFFTSGERAKAAREHGSARARLGEESQRAFDQCNLCLGRPVSPVASPAGFLSCRECILASLLAQRAGEAGLEHADGGGAFRQLRGGDGVLGAHQAVVQPGEKLAGADARAPLPHGVTSNRNTLIAPRRNA